MAWASLEKRREYRRENRERINELQRANWQENRPKRIAELKSKYLQRKENPELREHDRAARRAYYEKNKARIKARQQQRRSEINARNALPKNRIIQLCRAAAARAKRSGLPYDPAIRQVYSESPPTACACCYRPLDFGVKDGRLNSSSPSIDQIEPGMGYTLENTAIICWDCNSLKSNASAAKLERVLTYMRGVLTRPKTP